MKNTQGTVPKFCSIIIYVWLSLQAQKLLQSYKNDESDIHGFNNFDFSSRIRTLAT